MMRLFYLRGAGTAALHNFLYTTLSELSVKRGFCGH